MPELTGGLCVDENHDLFFADEDEKYDRKLVLHAKRICKECPIKLQCLEIAMADESLVGIWGGTTETDRKNMRRDLRSAATRDFRRAEVARTQEYFARKKMNLPGRREESAKNAIVRLSELLPEIEKNEKKSVAQAVRLRVENPNALLHDLSFQLGKGKGYMSHTVKYVLKKYENKGENK